MGNLPRTFRPRSCAKYREFRPGIDLPAEFFYDLKSIDRRLHLVWHHFRTETDPVMNEYTGAIDDPRFNIHEELGEEVWGWVLKNPDNSPILENTWHIWELHQHGWSHVCPILSSDYRYLSKLAYRLYLQTKVINKYGMKKYFELVKAGHDKANENQKKDLLALQSAVMDENKWLVNSAIENMISGKINPTNPTKEVISSFGGQTNRSKITRPLTDREGGIILPDQWRNE